MTSRITDYYEDDTTLIPVQLPGSPDLVGTTTTFVARNLDTLAAITPITCTNLTDAGALTIPIATLVATPCTAPFMGASLGLAARHMSPESGSSSPTSAARRRGPSGGSAMRETHIERRELMGSRGLIWCEWVGWRSSVRSKPSARREEV